jgi:hypothetical protein
MNGKSLFHFVPALLMSSFVNSMEDYLLFLSQGFVSIKGSREVKPVQILRDTCVA